MSRSIWRRVGVLFVLGVLLFGLAVWYGTLTPAPGLGVYPSEEHLATDYDRYLGTKVTVGGTVVDTEPMTISAEYGANEQIRLIITDLTVEANKGDNLRVYGRAAPGHTIQAINAFAVPPFGHVYTYSISFLAGLWMLWRIIRYWHFDLTDWTLRRRTTPLQPNVVDRIQSHIHQWRND
ncbi:hypothetical protein [Haladaptatus sp. DFWS20]|uniref:hypothetical protein n=1 Tax=Haladaptatus sp. DFWS20 TaxID=3403467 RepID=UPI003EBAB548